MNDKCPYCGADRFGETHIFYCLSEISRGKVFQSKDCRIRKLEIELAATKAKLERLKEAANEVIEIRSCFGENCNCCVCKLREAVEG